MESVVKSGDSGVEAKLKSGHNELEARLESDMKRQGVRLEDMHDRSARNSDAIKRAEDRIGDMEEEVRCAGGGTGDGRSSPPHIAVIMASVLWWEARGA